MQQAHASLYTPMTIGQTLNLQNRWGMAPMTRNMSPNNIPTAAMADYYAKRAAGGVGLIITEGTMINTDAHGDDKLPAFYGDEALNGWAHVVEQVHQHGGKIAPQLWHLGGLSKLGPSAVQHPNGQITPKEMSVADIKRTINDYATAAKNAKAIGFDAIELHGAHGYLIDQFFWGVTNKREDVYGGKALTARLTFAKELIAAVRAEVGDEFPISLRLSQWKMGDYDARLVDTEEALASWLLPLSDAGVDIFHMSTRRFWQPPFPATNMSLPALTKKITDKTVIAVGNIALDSDYVQTNKQATTAHTDFASITTIGKSIANDEFDLAAVGRMLITNPNLVNDIAEEKFADIKAYDVKDLETLR